MRRTMKIGTAVTLLLIPALVVAQGISGTDQDVGDVLNRGRDYFPIILGATTGIAGLLGVWMVLSGLVRGDFISKHRGANTMGGQATSWASPITSIVLGTILVFMAVGVLVSGNSVFGDDAEATPVRGIEQF